MTACATDRRFAAGSPLPPSACGSQQPRRPGRGCLDFPGKQSVHGRAMDQPLANPLLPALIATYLARCAVEGKSPRTVQAYRETLTRFSRCLVEDGAPLDPDSIRPDHVVAYLARFAARSPDTRHRYFREVRCFCTWLRAAGYANNDPFRGLRNVRLPRKIVPPLAPAEIARLIACCDANTVVGRRDRAILLTLLDTGVRCAEAVGLDLADCTLTEQRLLVRQGKGGKDRIVPFAGRCADALAAYCADRGPAPGPLFVAARYARLNAGVPSPAERAQTAAATPRPDCGRPAGARPPLPAHVRHLGHRPRRARARCPAPARPQFAGDGAPLQRHLRQRPGRPAPRRLLPRRRDARGCTLSGFPRTAHPVPVRPRASSSAPHDRASQAEGRGFETRLPLQSTKTP